MTLSRIGRIRAVLAILALGAVGAIALTRGAEDVRSDRAPHPLVSTAPSVLGFDFRRRHERLRSGVNYPHGHGTIAKLDPLTLRPVSRRVAVRGYVFGSEPSPDGTRLVLGTNEFGRVQVVDLATMRSLRTFRLPVSQPLEQMRWVTPDRIVAVTGYRPAIAWEFAAGDGAVRARHDLRGSAVTVARLPDGLAVLLAPPAGTGRARLALVRAGAVPRIVELAGVEAGYPRREGHDVPSDAPPDLSPGLAIGDGAAWVVDPRAFRVARVDLASGAVTTHDVGVAARAAKGRPYITRTAHWLGDGLLAVSGEGDRPFGLRVVDTTTWRARVVDPEADRFQVGAGAVLYVRRNRRGRLTTLVAYEPDGRRRFAFRPRFGIASVEVAGNYAYVLNGAPRRSGNRRMHVIDLRSGRQAATLSHARELVLLTRP